MIIITETKTTQSVEKRGEMKKVFLFTIVIIVALFLITTGCAKKEELGEAKNVDLYICSECGDTIKADTTDANVQYVVGKGLEYRINQQFQICEKCKERIAEKQAEEENKLGKIVGQWVIETPKGVYTIRNKKGTYTIEMKFSDGSTSLKGLTHKKIGPSDVFYLKNNDFGEYFMVDTQGNLNSYDKDGYISTLKLKK